MPAEAELIIAKVAVSAFRCLDRVDIALSPTTTVLVGENNAGKSSLLLALATALGKRRATTDDLHRSVSGTIAQKAVIDIFVTPRFGQSAFMPEVAQRLLGAIQRYPGTSDEVVGIRTSLLRSSESSLLIAQRTFLQPQEDKWIEAEQPSFEGRVLDLFDAHLLDASRDLLGEMGVQHSPWGRVMSDLRIPVLPDLGEGAADPDGYHGIERDLTALAGRVRSASPVLTELQEDLSRMAETQRTVARVDLVPLPYSIEDLGRGMEIVIHQNDSLALPLRFHGSGSRSLAALLVFKTMCALKSGTDRGLKPHLLTLLEEPEAHLHPHAVAALTTTIDSLPGQRVVSTHSPSLVGEVPPLSLRVFRRSATGITISTLNEMHTARVEQFRRFFGRPFGEVLFARLVVLGDGASEQNTLPTLVAMALNLEPTCLGVTFVDCQSMGDYNRVNKMLRALHDLGIPWIYFADNDAAGRTALANTHDPATGMALSFAHSAVVTLQGTKQLEQLLIDAGYGDEVTAIAHLHGDSATDDDSRLRFLRANKAWASEQVVRTARAAGKPQPAQIDDLISAIRTALGLPPNSDHSQST